MNGKELKAFFDEHLVPARLYKIGGKHNHRICMEKTGEGWDVFFSDQKSKIGVMHFHDETSACRAMKNEIRKLMEIMYGVTWVGEPC